MASKLYFELFIDQAPDAKRDSPDKVIGYFACMPWAAKYLDIENKAVDPTKANFIIRKSGGRTLTRIDGTSMTAGAANDGTAEGKVLVSLPEGKGMKRITLLSGKKIATSQAVNKAKAFHSLSFAFPSVATNLIVAQALGRIIPAAKISKDGTPSEADIFPWFRSEGGKRYPIIILGGGSADPDQPTVKVGSEVTDADVAAIESKTGGGKRKKAKQS